MSKLVECVPNFSEGRRPEVVRAIVAAGEKCGVKILDWTMDADHNRSVVTFAGEPEAVLEAALAMIREAAARINMEEHRGAHPRIGAADVVPFVPIGGVTMAECVALARCLGERVARELEIPVYLYEEAATRPERRNLAHVRRGEYEGLKEEIARPERRPDFGPARLHPTAGAVVIGARKPLIAFNVNLGTDDPAVARAIARALRAKDGGLTFVKALGVELKDRRQVQVSMNLVDYERTPIYRALELVRLEAARYGVSVVGTEIVGLVPLDALLGSLEYYLQSESFRREQVLEVKLNA
ncbi:glutamate formimidoyltransferase [Desulfofundulus thermobenzoicus]|uniref:glutamate formimidoyltransferase n=1 Tax=Desulfofundulus thermobenzoicus TaxID=29376 RepID=A0A6N7IS30_9FIRM|nr:glutamate formimidoyltransferase [Desulfofundulus thermobenzoicus]MQL52277.1 glutamate formimidoyltransferase [Desulfofundulus thermobenzoicus]